MPWRAGIVAQREYHTRFMTKTFGGGGDARGSCWPVGREAQLDDRPEEGPGRGGGKVQTA
ncbi:hypothetical protein PG995_000120 [Apiospora arundinis]